MYVLCCIYLKPYQRFECEILFKFETNPDKKLDKEEEISKRHKYSISMCDSEDFKNLKREKKGKEVPQ